jgi:cyclophilin family peptidyl-prolyl cis-trans isomerase
VRIASLLATVILLAGCGSSSTPVTGTLPPATPFPQKTWTAAPPVTIDKKHNYTATFQTTDGTFVAQLLVKVAPITVNNFVFLARQGFYNHVLFHRIMANFMVQTGDPTGTGTGGPGYTIKDEPVHLNYTPGTLAMANTGVANSGGSQFFIVVQSPFAQLSKTYTIFGKVTSGMDVVYKISHTPVGQDPASQEVSHPLKHVYIEKLTIR